MNLPQKNKSDSELLDEAIQFFEELHRNNTIEDLEISTQATIDVIKENMICHIRFVVPDGLTIEKFNILKDWIEEHFPIFQVKKLYHKHRIMLYYHYEHTP